MCISDKTINLKKIKFFMNILSKRIVLLASIAVFLNFNFTYAQTESDKIAKLIEQKRVNNKKNKYYGGFKIQLFNGNESQAYKIKRDFDAAYPDYPTVIIYKSPEWKTQVGPFKTRLEADRTLLIIKDKFIGAIVLEEKL